jgi:phage gp46-like protein
MCPLPFPYSINQINNQPLTNPPVPVIDLVSSSNQVSSARVIDPITQDYVLNENGTFQGQSASQTAVYLALLTILNSSAVYGQGVDFTSISVITPNINARVTNVVQQALMSLINQGLVALVSCQVVQTGQSILSVQVDWQDLTVNSAGQALFQTNIPLTGSTS